MKYLFAHSDQNHNSRFLFLGGPESHGNSEAASNSSEQNDTNLFPPLIDSSLDGFKNTLDNQFSFLKHDLRNDTVINTLSDQNNEIIDDIKQEKVNVNDISQKIMVDPNISKILSPIDGAYTNMLLDNLQTQTEINNSAKEQANNTLINLIDADALNKLGFPNTGITGTPEEQVRKIQRILISAGHDDVGKNGKPDGWGGDRTQAALSQFIANTNLLKGKIDNVTVSSSAEIPTPELAIKESPEQALDNKIQEFANKIANSPKYAANINKLDGVKAWLGSIPEFDSPDKVNKVIEEAKLLRTDLINQQAIEFRAKSTDDPESLKDNWKQHLEEQGFSGKEIKQVFKEVDNLNEEARNNEIASKIDDFASEYTNHTAYGQEAFASNFKHALTQRGLNKEQIKEVFDRAKRISDGADEIRANENENETDNTEPETSIPENTDSSIPVEDPVSTTSTTVETPTAQPDTEVDNTETETNIPEDTDSSIPAEEPVSATSTTVETPTQPDTEVDNTETEDVAADEISSSYSHEEQEKIKDAIPKIKQNID